MSHVCVFPFLFLICTYSTVDRGIVHRAALLKARSWMWGTEGLLQTLLSFSLASSECFAPKPVVGCLNG